MIVLPSGHVVGITSERARYHATRQGIRVTAETPFEELYRLVDIVYGDDAERGEGLSSRYRFTGHTLAEVAWLNRWKPADRAAFRHWIGEEKQHREIEGARRKIIYDTLPHEVVSHPAPEKLFSVLRRRLLAMELNAAPAEQWRNTILNMTKCGVRQEEIRWSGVLDFLDQAENRDEKVSREEVISRVEFGPIRLELTNELIGAPQPRLPFEEDASIMPCAQFERSGLKPAAGEIPVVRLVNRPLNYRVGFLKQAAADEPTSRHWFALAPYDRALSLPGEEEPALFPDRQSACEAAARHARDHYHLRNSLQPSDKYAFMTLHGGQNYREWLVTLPDYQPSHYTPHFTERNVLLHFRTKERRDPEGRKLLHVEEIQSDWHQQAARSANWRARIPEAPFAKEWSLLAVKIILLQAVDAGCDGVSWTPGETQQMRFQCDASALRRLYDKEIPQHLTKLAKDWDGHCETTRIDTREPWISAYRSGAYWSVRDKEGRFTTRGRFSKRDAVALCERHSKRIELSVPVFYIPDGMRERIENDGLPRFGDVMVDKVKKPLCDDASFSRCDPRTRRRCTGEGNS